jgi:hypothetical protein
MDSLTFLQNINSNINSAILSVLNLVLFIELTIACCWGMYQAWTIGEATSGKITELALYSAILFGAWQWWPQQEWVWFAVLPQCAFVVFAGGLVGCTLRWGVERVFSHC